MLLLAMCFITNVIIFILKFSAYPIYFQISAIVRICLKWEFKPKYALVLIFIENCPALGPPRYPYLIMNSSLRAYL